jgi:hypothetical protein
VEELPLQEFAESLGLAGMPKIKFLQGSETREKGVKLPDEAGVSNLKSVRIGSIRSI